LTPPTISGVNTGNVSATSATINWSTDEAADSQVEYGVTNLYGNRTTLNTAFITSHSVDLGGLLASMIYHYRIKSRDASGNLATSSDFTFTTANPPDTTPPSISAVASSGVTSIGATVAWITDEPSDTQVDYGTTINYGSAKIDGALVVGHSVLLGGLASNTTYHYRVSSRDAAGNLAVSSDFSFTTTIPPDTTPPVISGVASNNVSSGGATLVWTTDEPADAQVEYGVTTSYGSSTTLNTALMTSHSAELTGLMDSTTYHFRVKSRDASGNLAVSSDLILTTIAGQTSSRRFFIVDDSARDSTFQYDAAGNSVGSYGLGAINMSPRGITTTAARSKFWVLDANRTVYVYDAGGGLLGSWVAGTLSSKSSPQGIATDGTDIWIVDSKSDRVFRYTGAAARLSGSQNSTSSFALFGGNPKGITTDGYSLWIVNAASTDKVYKYAVAGTLIGSWAIDPQNSSPTGITIDPANVHDIWIVDSGADKVFQYSNAATRTAGRQYSDANFVLAPGNTNPQDIVDPPFQGAIPSVDIASGKVTRTRSTRGISGQTAVASAVTDSRQNDESSKLLIADAKATDLLMSSGEWIEQAMARRPTSRLTHLAPHQLELQILSRSWNS